MNSIIEKDLQLLEQVLKECNIKLIPSKNGASINGMSIDEYKKQINRVVILRDDNIEKIKELLEKQ